MDGGQSWVKRSVRAVRVLWILVQIAILGYALWVIVYIVGRVLMPGEAYGFIGATHNLAPWFGPIGFVLLLATLAFSRWRWPFLVLLAPGLIAFAIWHGGMLLPVEDVSVPPGSQTLGAASFNILSARSDPERIPDAIRALDVDIVGLQEVGPEHAATIDAQLSDLYPHRVLEPDEPVHYGVALLSRYPITAQEIYRPLPESMLHMRAELDVEGTPIVVYVIHPWPPKNRTNPFAYDNTMRNDEIQETLERVQQETGPVLLLCDCNLPDQSVEHDDMDAVLNDAFQEMGWGFGFTFPAYRRFVPSLIRIDYVWYNDFFKLLSSETAANPGTSDHRPIQAELALLAGGSAN